MATKTLFPVEIYERTSFAPDREYVDGDVRERNLGTLEHAKVQGLFVMWFNRHVQEWKIQAWPEWRVRVSSERTRIPDVTVVCRGSHPSVLVEAPLIVIEVLSPDDTYGEIRERAIDYVNMGIRNIWLVDPLARTGQVFCENRWVDVKEFAVPSTPIRITLTKLFEEYDQY